MTSPSHSFRARAKVNLCLHVVGQRADGYHLLDSLVVFPEIGDRVDAEPSKMLGLSIDGPFAIDLDAGGDNLVLKAADALDVWAREQGDLRPRGAALTLEKNLPVASGIGGGSTDAAAALKALCGLWGLAPSPETLGEIGLRLGADVPVCLSDAPSWMRGVGEIIAPAPSPPSFWMVLVNPGVAVSTPQVFKALTSKENPPPPQPEAFADLDAFVDWLGATRNDLEAPARALRPEIDAALAALAAAEACRFARMSGSGATCFGVFTDGTSALAAADRLRVARPDWWIVAAPVSA